MNEHDYELIETFRPEVIWELHRCKDCGAEKLVKDESSEIRGRPQPNPGWSKEFKESFERYFEARGE